MWEVILGNSGRAVGKWDKEGKEAAKGCVINQASYHRGHLGLGPTKELQDRAKSVSGVISDRGAREIGYLTHHLPSSHWSRAASRAFTLPHFGSSCDWVPAPGRKAVGRKPRAWQ